MKLFVALFIAALAISHVSSADTLSADKSYAQETVPHMMGGPWGGPWGGPGGPGGGPPGGGPPGSDGGTPGPIGGPGPWR